MAGYLQANSQAENFNRTLLHGFKTRLHPAGAFWVDELFGVLWAYRTTSRSATQKTPFFLTYGFETAVHVEFYTLNPRMAAYVVKVNDEEQRADLDLFEEKRDVSTARVTLYKNILANYYNAQVKHLCFRLGDLVKRKNLASQIEPQEKLTPRWEELYRVVKSNLNAYCKFAY
ncbi:uncharacterized protein LOC113771106 [Coffea eugenioides]|uniref:uncharacterized protein LOC113771106 n=1 Tax=Coffea eugenioides TaxID=49369 RepID=UPI000F614E5B|nr:uncharacterized protein LOC113771106 [Coffea eugenioides]